MGRGQVITFGEVDEWETLYASGMSSNDVGVRVGRSGRVVREHLSKRDALRSRSDAAITAVNSGKIASCELRRDTFATLTPESVWVLGLLYGDGHVQVIPGEQYGVTLAGDEAVCRKARTVIGSDVSLDQCSENCWRWTVYSKQMVEDLAGWGVSAGNKALTIRYPDNLPDELEGHFLRGLWDSDGHWKSGERGAAYTSASEGFILDLQKRVGGRINHGSSDKVKVGAEWWILSLRKAEARRLKERIYEGAVDRMECSRKRGIAFGEVF